MKTARVHAANQPLMALICAGIAVESILLGKLEDAKVGAAAVAHYNSEVSAGRIVYKTIPSGFNQPANWSLAQLIEIARIEKLIVSRDAQMLHGVRDWRNLVHPNALRNEMKSLATGDLSSAAGLAVALADYAIRLVM